MIAPGTARMPGIAFTDYPHTTRCSAMVRAAMLHTEHFASR